MTTASERAYVAADNGKAWSMPIDVIDPTGADDNFAYIRNDGANPLIIHRINIGSTVTGVLQLTRCTGTPSTLTAAVPVNKKSDGGSLPDATVGTGVDITGLTEVGVVSISSLLANSPHVIEYPEGIRIPLAAPLCSTGHRRPVSSAARCPSSRTTSHHIHTHRPSNQSLRAQGSSQCLYSRSLSTYSTR
jgi:hypothetical protein